MIGVMDFLGISNLAKRPYNPKRREYSTLPEAFFLLRAH
jgi:hypothetical protein